MNRRRPFVTVAMLICTIVVGSAAMARCGIAIAPTVTNVYPGAVAAGYGTERVTITGDRVFDLARRDGFRLRAGQSGERRRVHIDDDLYRDDARESARRFSPPVGCHRGRKRSRVESEPAL
jgi:hypothetical protein